LNNIHFHTTNRTEKILDDRIFIRRKTPESPADEKNPKNIMLFGF
jgi:hypothetical protein